MTAERMFREYKNLKKEQGILLFQLEQFSGIEESDVIDSMMFGHADDNDRVQTSNRSDKTASVAINYKRWIGKTMNGLSFFGTDIRQS